MTHLAVLGGSVAGLSLALLAARRGVRVTVVEADDDATPAVPGAPLDGEHRWVTPQAAHSHAFLARARRLLLDEAPDVLAALLEAGVHERDLVANRPPSLPPLAAAERDDDLVVLLARRTTFEHVLRAVVAAEAGVELRTGVAVEGLVLDLSGAVPHVAGLRLEDGSEVLADVVADAGGRRGRAHRWLTSAGVELDVSDDDCGIAYHTRFYRLREGAGWGGLNRVYTAGSSFDRYSGLVFPGDGDTFSLTFGTLPEDRELRGLRDDEGFQAAGEAIPVLADWVSPERAEPASEVRTMTRMRNRVRRWVVDGLPTVTGYVPVADAAAISNPAHSRGCTLALAHAVAVAAAVADHADDPEALALAVDAATERELLPWVHDSRLQDASRLSRWRPEEGIVAPSPPRGTVTNGRAYVASHHDAVVWARFTRLQQLLATPDEVLTDRDVVARVQRVEAQGLGLPNYGGPSHEELADLLERITGGARATASA